MNLEQYKKANEHIFQRVQDRILNQGAEQYDMGELQKFEGKDLQQIVQDTLEEIEDAIAYLMQLHIRIHNFSRD